MSEVRKPIYSLLLRTSNTSEGKKVEIFSGEDFPVGGYINTATGVSPRSHKNLYRIRVDGRWFPSGVKHLFNKSQVSTTIAEIMWRTE